MLTSKGISLLISIFALLIIAWNTDITIIYIFFVVVFVIFILSFIHLQVNIPEINITREVFDTAYEDDVLNVRMDVVSKRSLNVYFFEVIDKFSGAPIDEENISLFILDLKGKENKKISYMVNCYKRGMHRFGPISLISQDALGFFRMRKTLNVHSETLVYPNLFRVFNFPELISGSVSWLGVETARISGDSHEFFGIREYQRGDAMSRIHWLSTARHNKLIVKQFERNAVQEATIVLDLKKGRDIGVGRETTLEYSVKIAGSIARYLLNEGVFVQMVGYGKNAMTAPFGKGESHMYKILESLAKADSDGDMNLNQALEEASFITPYRSTLITIMLDNDMDALSSLVQFKVKGIKLVAVILSASTFGTSEESGGYLDKEAGKKFDEALANLEAYVYRVSKGDDLEKKFGTV